MGFMRQSAWLFQEPESSQLPFSGTLRAPCALLAEGALSFSLMQTAAAAYRRFRLRRKAIAPHRPASASDVMPGSGVTVAPNV